MKLSQYGYDFSPEMLAKCPADNRDESRLMVINRAKGTIEHRIFKDIIEYFDEKDLFVFNDTKVFPARLYGNKEQTGAEIEIFLLRELNRELRLWDVLVDPARKIRIGNKLYFGDDDLLVAEVEVFFTPGQGITDDGPGWPTDKLAGNAWKYLTAGVQYAQGGRHIEGIPGPAGFSSGRRFHDHIDEPYLESALTGQFRADGV